MTRASKSFYLLALGVFLNVIGTTLASAQGVVFLASASSPRQIRAEGVTEAVGTVAFSARSSGTMVVDSLITLDYGTLVNPASGTVVNGCGNGALSKSVSGNVVTLKVIAPIACVVGQTISVTGVRVNANALGAGAKVTVNVSALVPAQFSASNPISFLQFTELTLATVQPKAATVELNGGLLLLAKPFLASFFNGERVKFTVRENFNQAFLSRKDEQGLNNTGAVEDFKIRFAFRGVPVGLRIDSVDRSASDPTLGVLTVSGLPFTSTAGLRDGNVDITIDEDDSGTDTTGSPESLVAEFSFSVPNLAVLAADQSGTVQVELIGADAPLGVPRFASSPLIKLPEPVPSSLLPPPAPIAPRQVNVTDAASLATGSAVVAPGILASAFPAFGVSALTGVSQNFAANSLPLPKMLGGVTIRLGGTLTFESFIGWKLSPIGSVEAPLLFVGPGQVNFQVPPGISLGDSVPLQVQKADGSTLLSTVRVVVTSPRIFTALRTGQGQGAVLNQDYSQNGNPQLIPGAKPAARGSVIRIFATGAGETDPPLLPGEAAPAGGNPLVLTRVQPTVSIGGIPATVLDSVMAPGYPGVWQVDAEVPPTVTPGPAVSLFISAGGSDSNPVTIAVE
ncbi:MAG: hypothetical protein A3J28_12950 [Acidobacteria bacterium RIFCSPLOWO2_12_FULL_60_22]|nr:MAG: hypothetical protein A3J28_12950 [Acidobacteria bacterium RIFCSPLOWO2_12_FULL_60_22]